LPDASVFFAGENREALVRNDDPSFPLMSSYAGLLPAGDPDQGVPVGQIFYPAYLFKDGGTRAARPAVAKAPDTISYRGHFDITIAGDPRQIASVALLRSDHNTHSFTGGDRHVTLAFDLKDGDNKRGSEDKRTLRVVAPQLPAQGGARRVHALRG
jgi:galactose oxidase